MDSIVLLDRRTKRSRGFGFVTFADEVSSYVVPFLRRLFASCMNQLPNLTCISTTLERRELPSKRDTRSHWPGQYLWKELRDQSK